VWASPAWQKGLLCSAGLNLHGMGVMFLTKESIERCGKTVLCMVGDLLSSADLLLDGMQQTLSYMEEVFVVQSGPAVAW